MRRRRNLILALVALALGLVLGTLVAGIFSVGEPALVDKPIDLMERSGAVGEIIGLPRAALADSCRTSRRDGCDSLLTASCWDGPDGLTQYVCLTTPAGDGWQRLPEGFAVPGRSISASGTGTYVAVEGLIMDRTGARLGQATDGRSWFGDGDLLLLAPEDGTVQIATLDGAILETIDNPPPYLGRDSFEWRSWALSHDRSRIAILSGISTSELWLYDRNKREWSLLQNDPDYLFLPFITGVGFSPDDGAVLTMRIAHDDDGSKPVRRFWAVAVDVDRGSVTTIREVRSEHGIYSSVSPDGSFMAIANRFFETRVLNLETAEVSDRVTLCCDPHKPSWSPDCSFFTTWGGFVVEVAPTPIPQASGPYDLRVPDPHDVNLPRVRFQSTPSR